MIYNRISIPTSTIVDRRHLSANRPAAFNPAIYYCWITVSYSRREATGAVAQILGPKARRGLECCFALCLDRRSFQAQWPTRAHCRSTGLCLQSPSQQSGCLHVLVGSRQVVRRPKHKDIARTRQWGSPGVVDASSPTPGTS